MQSRISRPQTRQKMVQKQAREQKKGPPSFTLTVRLDLETYKLIEEASRLTFGKIKFSDFIRMSARTAAIEKLGPKPYREFLDKLGIVKRPEDLEE